MEFICLFLPACVALSIRYRRNGVNEKLTVAQICQWAKWVIAINVLTMLSVLCVFGFSEILTDAFGSFSFALKYLGIATVFAIVLAYVIEITQKYIEISVEIGRIDENV